MWHNIDRPNEFELPPALDELPRIMPYFYVPLLENKPQNPIMDSLKLEKMNTNLPMRSYQAPSLPPELVALTLDVAQNKNEETLYKEVEELWKNATTRKLGVKNGLLSWDRLRRSHSDKASSTPFLSEQGDRISTMLRYYVQPRVYNAKDSMIRATQKELFLSLKMTVLGISSKYHVWDSTSERFVQVGTIHNEKKGFLLIDGKDEVVSDSLIARFLKIGTLLRRLELFLSTLRTRSAKEGPTIHSLAHSLSTTLDYLRNVLTQSPPSHNQIRGGSEDLPLLAIWSHYAIYEDLVDALADVYGRNYDSPPKDYTVLDLMPVPLLSHIYDQLHMHFERCSSNLIRAAIAFLLALASQGYLTEVAHSVGFGGQPSQKRSNSGRRQIEQYDLDLDEEDDEEDIFDLLDTIGTKYPTFFPEKVLRVLPAAQKSLVLLRIAQPDHLLLVKPAANSSIRWLWTEEEINAAWNEVPLPPNLLLSDLPSTTSATSLPTKHYKPELLDFGIFDLEPGDAVSASLQVKNNSVAMLDTFVKQFPESLPPITPTLPELTSLIFKGLMDHSASLSSSLLSLILNSPGTLNFRSHLVILRSFLLVAAPSFKSRLLSALFSDACEYEVNTTAHSMSIQSSRRRAGKALKESTQPWAVGLSPNLLERETWPPVGADLSFFLRTVIVDSLDTGSVTENGKIEREQVLEEAGWRLGFAIRDLPTGPGRDKWLNPLCIEALDFLYMDYKPPHPLEILISPDILSKYQRMFTFILRLFRVESALKSLFRMSSHRTTANFLFPTLSQSRKLLLHFRFISQAFITGLSGYIFDTAIGGNFDPFLTQLSLDNPSTLTSGNVEFSDVFELAQRHSALLDDILSACLLRSGQRGVGDILRHSLELVLEFTIVVGELHRRRIEEYQAAPLIEDLFRKFNTKLTTLTRVLKGVVEKTPSLSQIPWASHTDGSRRRPTGGLDALYHLLTRIDLTDWWSKERKKPRDDPEM